jgi:hypothetical protein
LLIVIAPLDGAWKKIDRADLHFQELEAKILGGPGQDTLHLVQKFDPNTNTIEVTLEGVRDIPIDWSLIAADVVQNLRSALNYVAWELAVWHLDQQGATREPEWNTQFSINTQARKFSAHYVRDIHPDHVRFIQEMQPNGVRYLSQRSEIELLNIPVEAIASQHPLAQLAELTNEDKHRVLLRRAVIPGTMRVGSYEGIDCIVNDSNIFMQRELENGAKWAEFKVTPTGPEPEVKMDDSIDEIAVVFGTCRCQVGMLPLIRDAVADIVTEFQRLIV